MVVCVKDLALLRRELLIPFRRIKRTLSLSLSLVVRLRQKKEKEKGFDSFYRHSIIDPATVFSLPSQMWNVFHVDFTSSLNANMI